MKPHKQRIQELRIQRAVKWAQLNWLYPFAVLRVLRKLKNNE